MNNRLSLPALFVVVILSLAARVPGAEMPLPRSSPEAQGLSSEAVRRFVEASDKINTLHSFMIVRHGQVIGEGWWKPEAADKPHVLHSLSKSFSSTAIGLAIADGKLSLEDPVLKFFPDAVPAEPPENLKLMKVRDLLTMSCGHDTEPKSAAGGPSVKQFLAHPVPHPPGTHFQYNTMGTYMLSAILTKVTGQTVLEYLKPRLFEPLGIADPRWDSSPEGNSLGGYGLYLCTEDIAKFGQLYLQKGKWNDKQLIPESWIAQATSKQVPNDQESHSKIGIDWRQGYGFQFWRCTHDAFRGDGAAGQLCVVIADKDAVIAITADTGDIQGELNAIWNNLYPAFQSMARPEDAGGQEKVKQAVARLQAHPAKKNFSFNGTDLTGWRKPTGDWLVAESVSLNPTNDERFAIAPGQGILVNGAKGNTVELLTEAEFGDVEIHTEFCIPRHSNSGVYLMGRYEIQIYDSFGVEKDKYPGIECGGIYGRWINEKNVEGHSPRVNVSKPPGEWQSFDITFRAPRFDASGKKTENAKMMKVVHNGTTIHENVELTGPTRSALWEDEKPTGPLRLQGNHGPVAFRNLRIRPIEVK